jgi:hypothetical protein
MGHSEATELPNSVIWDGTAILVDQIRYGTEAAILTPTENSCLFSIGLSSTIQKIDKRIVIIK